jgi:hypothetical protein
VNVYRKLKITSIGKDIPLQGKINDYITVVKYSHQSDDSNSLE